jgi:hypothetical protein
MDDVDRNCGSFIYFCQYLLSSCPTPSKEESWQLNIYLLAVFYVVEIRMFLTKILTMPCPMIFKYIDEHYKFVRCTCTLTSMTEGQKTWVEKSRAIIQQRNA